MCIEDSENISISNGPNSGFMFWIRGETSAAVAPLKHVQLNNLKVSNASYVAP